MRTLRIAVFIALASGVAAASESRFERIEFSHPATLKIFGEGVVLPDGHIVARLLDNSGRRVEWRAKGSEIDDSGELRLHMAYHQIVVLPSGLPAQVDGTELRLHFDQNRTLQYASGMQATALVVNNVVMIEPSAAAQRALAALRSSPRESWNRAVVSSDENPDLVIRTVQSNSLFAYVVEVIDGEGMPHQLWLDAEIGAVLQTIPRFADANCIPDTTVYNTATGTPVRSGYGVAGIRTLTATGTTSPRPNGYLHEGHYNVTAHVPVTVFHGTSDSAWVCSGLGGDGRDYTVFPVQPSLEYDTDGVWQGRHAGDAMHFTIQTMLAFQAFGRNGWDNLRSTAKDGSTRVLET